MSIFFSRCKRNILLKHVKVGEGEFLGKMLKQNSDYSISITQRDYAEAVTCIPISKERRKHKDQEATEQEKRTVACGAWRDQLASERFKTRLSCSMFIDATKSN